MQGRGHAREWALGAAMALVLVAVAVGTLWLRGGDDAVAPPEPAEARPPSPADPARDEVLDSLAEQAGNVRVADPRAALQLLERALVRDPTRHDLRVEAGVLHWALGDDGAARAAWERVPAGASHAGPARVMLALEALVRATDAHDDTTARGELQEHLARLRRAPPPGRWARIWDAIVEPALASYRPGWEAALIRAVADEAEPRADRRAVIEDWTRVINEVLPTAWAYRRRGALRWRSGDTAGAMADWDAALRLQPDSIAVLGARAEMRAARGDTFGAIGDLSAALTFDPSNASAWTARAAVRLAGGDATGALADYDSALRLQPAHVNALAGRARARQAVGDLLGALADLDAALAVNPRDAAAWSARAGLRRTQGDMQGALADYDAAIALDPSSAAAFAGRAAVRRTLGDLNGALADCDRALALDPALASARWQRGLVHQALGRHAEALADFRACLALSPAGPDAAATRAALAETEQAQAAGDAAPK